MRPSTWTFSATWWALTLPMAAGSLARFIWFGMQIGWIWANGLVVGYAERHGDPVRAVPLRQRVE